MPSAGVEPKPISPKGLPDFVGTVLKLDAMYYHAVQSFRHRSLNAVVGMVSELAKQLNREIPYWLNREPGEMNYFESCIVADVRPVKCGYANEARLSLGGIL